VRRGWFASALSDAEGSGVASEAAGSGAGAGCGGSGAADSAGPSLPKRNGARSRTVERRRGGSGADGAGSG